MAPTQGTNISKLWRTAGREVAATLLATAVFLTSTPEVSAQYQQNGLPPADYTNRWQQAPSVPNLETPPPQTAPPRRSVTSRASCLDAQQLIDMAGMPLQAEQQARIKQLPFSNGGRAILQNSIFTLARELNGIRHLVTVDSEGRFGSYFGVNIDGNVKDSAQRIPLLYEKDPAKTRIGDFSIAKDILADLFKNHPLSAFSPYSGNMNAVQPLLQYMELLQQISSNKLYTADGRVDMNKIDGNRQKQAEELQKFMHGWGWSIVDNQPLVVVMPTSVNQITAVPAVFVGAKVPIVYFSLIVPGEINSDTTLGELFAAAAQANRTNDPSRLSSAQQLLITINGVVGNKPIVTGKLATPLEEPTPSVGSDMQQPLIATQRLSNSTLAPKEITPGQIPRPPVLPPSRPPQSISDQVRTNLRLIQAQHTR